MIKEAARKGGFLLFGIARVPWDLGAECFGYRGTPFYKNLYGWYFLRGLLRLFNKTSKVQLFVEVPIEQSANLSPVTTSWRPF